MEKVSSFQIDHTKLQRGLYVSRQETFDDEHGGHTVTTFDIRVCRPYFEQTMDACAIHTIEHLGATFLRSKGFYSKRIIYFGPMGCQTGFYLVIDGKVGVEDVKGTVREMFAWISTYEGPIPGNTKKECGNADMHDITEARAIAHRFFNETLCNLDETNTVYPMADNTEQTIQTQ